MARQTTSMGRLATLSVIAILALARGAAAAEPAKIDFLTQIQPILVEHCYACHGPDKQESSLRLDVREQALKGGEGGPLLIAGKRSESELHRRIAATDDDERMPPVDSQIKPLSAAQIETIATWIDQGGAWPESKSARSSHWAYQPVERREPPAVKNAAWARGAIDRFVLAQLEARGMTPSPEADRYTLIKRLSYDLLGLPPTTEQVDAFVNDASADAYEKLVGRLLDSPRFGERWARHWLDMARFADSDGYEKDNPRPDAWRYRDWVIEAINADLPLDRFTIQQLAGDLLPGATANERLATAFHRQTLTNTEGGTDQEQFRVEATFDRVITTGSVWLGLTLMCAQCHTHKYDPISHQEYYQLFAFFNNGDETQTDVPLTGEPLSQWIKEKQEAEQKLGELEPKLAQLRAELTAKLPAWEAEIRAVSDKPLDFHPVELVGIQSSGGAEFKLLSDGSYLASGNNPDVEKTTVTVKSDLKEISGFRIETLAHDSLGGRGPGRTPHGNFVLSEFQAFASASSEFKPEQRVELQHAFADFAQDGFSAANVLDGKDNTGWAVGGQLGRDHSILLMAKQPIPTSASPWLQLVLNQNHGTQHTIGRFRVMAVTGHDPRMGIPQNIRDLLAVAAEKRTAEQAQTLAEYFVGQDAGFQELTGQVQKLRERVAAQPTMKARVISQRTEKPRETHVLSRGDFLQPDALVQPAALSALHPMKPRGGGAPDRLDLAHWLVDPANPLTPRVVANQLWSYLFGRGIVRTVNDFGVRGDRPTHPELLDWLASELIARGWSRKEMIRLIVSSAAYRQASIHRPELIDADPLNDGFYRQNRYRVEGEVVRDLTLATAGLLSAKIGGPSVYPPLPPGITALSYNENFKWADSTGEDRYRRGMYTFFKRTAPHPNLSTFDCPDANTTCVQRRTSNTPLQALTTLNNESFVEASQAMARRLLGSAQAAGDEQRLTLALRWCIVRMPTSDELLAFGELLSASRTWYASHAAEATTLVGAFQPEGASPAEAASWVATVRMMMNLDEFLTRE